MEGGPLGVTGSNKIIGFVNRELDIANRAGNLVVYTQDWHPPDHSSFGNPPEYRDGSWPVHCVAHTEGALIHRDIRLDNITVPRLRIVKGFRKEKEEYSGFDPGALAPILNKLNNGRGPGSFKICGLATDYCVKHTAMDAKRLFPECVVTIMSEACAGVAQETTAKAMAEMMDAGIRIM